MTAKPVKTNIKMGKVTYFYANHTATAKYYRILKGPERCSKRNSRTGWIGI